MPSNVKFEEGRIQQTIEEDRIQQTIEEDRIRQEDRVSRATRLSKRNAERHFENFVNEAKENVEQLLEDKSRFERTLIRYFSTYRVKNGELPKKNTLNVVKSNLKMMFLKKTGGKVDITNSAIFPNLSQFFQNFYVKLDRSGKGDVKHVEEIPSRTMKKIYQLLSTLSHLMELDEKNDAFKRKLCQLPFRFHQSYHHLVQYGAIFVLLSHFARKERQGLEFLTKKHFKVFTDTSGVKYWKKVTDKGSEKHNPDDDEDVDGDSGLILFKENAMGFNPGRYFENYVGKLHAKSNWLFQRPMRRSHRFVLHENPPVWYEKHCKIGENYVAKALPTLGEVLGFDGLTNRQIRLTSIRTSKRAANGTFQDRDPLPSFSPEPEESQDGAFSDPGEIWTSTGLVDFDGEDDEPAPMYPVPEQSGSERDADLYCEFGHDHNYSLPNNALEKGFGCQKCEYVQEKFHCNLSECERLGAELSELKMEVDSLRSQLKSKHQPAGGSAIGAPSATFAQQEDPCSPPEVAQVFLFSCLLISFLTTIASSCPKSDSVPSFQPRY